MTAAKKEEFVYSKIWEEVPEVDNPFAATACYCSGYDVYGDLLGKASWIEYLYLLFKQEAPTKSQAMLLEGLAIAIANPGPRDHSIRAAMNAGVGGSTHASCLMAALAVGAGQLGGAREVVHAMESWQECGHDLESWINHLSHFQQHFQQERADVWGDMEHPPGFDPNGEHCATPVQQTLAWLVKHSSGNTLRWLQKNHEELEVAADCPLTMTGVAAAALIDLEFSSAQGEMLYLLLRLPGAAVHALEQEEYGYKRYPFFKDGLELLNDPGPVLNQPLPEERVG